MKGVWGAGGLTAGRMTLVGITDGTSNTIVFGEVSGRHQVYVRRTPVTPNGAGQAGWALNAAYFDYNIAVRLRGVSNDGVTTDGGCCVVNCTNTRGASQGQLYSFHTGGVNSLRGDGSVQFLKESTAPAIVGAMVSRAGGEVVTDN
jgi:hypothetical protein